MTEKKLRRLRVRNAVFKRDDYKCKVCKTPGYDRQSQPVAGKVPLDAHHITDRHNFEDGGYTTNNLITVCTECHLKAEKWHQTNGKEHIVGYHPNTLFKLIGTNMRVS